MKTAKRKGTRNEHRTEEHLQKLGMTVIRAAGSLGMWDLVAYDASRFRLVQVKSNRKPSTQERLALEAQVVPSNCTKELFIWHDRNPLPEIITIPTNVPFSADVKDIPVRAVVTHPNWIRRVNDQT